MENNCLNKYVKSEKADKDWGLHDGGCITRVGCDRGMCSLSLQSMEVKKYVMPPNVAQRGSIYNWPQEKCDKFTCNR